MRKSFCDLFTMIFGKKKISDDYESYSLEEQEKTHTIHMDNVPEFSVNNETVEVSLKDCSGLSEEKTYVFHV